MSLELQSGCILALPNIPMAPHVLRFKAQVLQDAPGSRALRAPAPPCCSSHLSTLASLPAMLPPRVFAPACTPSPQNIWFLSLLLQIRTHLSILSEVPLPTLLKNLASLPLAHSLHPPHLALTFFLHRTDCHLPHNRLTYLFCKPSFTSTEAQEGAIFVPYLLTQS